ncbi:hypothetical protein BO86DRAFT_402798 [Aspergillus japonicus CBS 114.51]|uniref:Zn(2)-C6 fungal-type domain-containing protein n=1 Tax=Aspergillus japonicus CBS 114.51 TaxID=1448312 RepID=A0A8T8WRV3_ASPJA|nr:hypothetical protein BO86DRAFT_402798 [Aspergillus japonicus CBS 114.51]RAH78400.1 hypothetical protein BO86DRAFT_402798 [Aspergillus japonicus CBS 114.51]
MLNAHHDRPPSSSSSSSNTRGSPLSQSRHEHHDILKKRKACEACRRSKTKCDSSMNSRCSRCEKMGISCTRNEQRYKTILRREAMINHLEGKLERLETHLSSIFGTGAEEMGSLPDTPPDDTGLPVAETNHPGLDPLDDFDIEDFLDQQQPVSTTMRSDSVVRPVRVENGLSLHQERPPCFYIPRCLSNTGAGCFSVLTNEGLDWISQKADSSHLDFLLGSVASEPQLSSLLPPRKLFASFPRAELLTQLLHDYMEKFNITLPVFTQADIDSLFAGNYADPHLHGPGQWTSIHVILAVAYMLPSTRGQPDHQISSLFMKGALQAINEILLAPPDLWACKSILVMAVLFLSLSAAHPCSSLIAIAVQISNHLDLGNAGSLLRCPVEERQDRHLLFLMICAMDNEISYRFGVPPAQKEDIFAEVLQISYPSNAYSVPIRNESDTFNLFHPTAELVQIRSQIVRQLYLASAVSKSFDQLLALTGEFDQKLQAWLRKLPRELQPGSGANPPFRQQPVFPTLLFIHYAYYDCMIAIHSLVAMRGVNTAQDLLGGLSLSTSPGFSDNPRVLLSTSLMSKAARASLGLLKYLPRDDINLGIAYHYPSVAMKTLASSIIRSPQPASEIYNLKTLHQAELYLSQTARDSTLEAIRRLSKACTDCCAVAQRAMDAA